MIKLYKVYIAASFISPFLASTIFFILFLLTFEVFRLMQLVSSSDTELSFLFFMMVDVGVTLVPTAIPLSVFFSVLYCVGKISSDSEYIAMRSFGLNKTKIYRPIFYATLLVSVVMFFVTQRIVPMAHKRLRKKINIVSSASLIQGIKSGQFFTTIPNITLFSQKVDEKTLKMENVFLKIHDPSKKGHKTIHASKGQIIHKKDDKTGLETFELELLDGNMLNLLKGQEVEKALFKKYLLPVSSKRFSYRPSTKEITMNFKELSEFTKLSKEEVIKRGHVKRLYINSMYEYWNRWNILVLIVVLGLLGTALGVRPTRSKGKGAGAKAIITLVGYYAIFFSCVSLGRSEKIPMSLAILVPTFLFGFYSYKKFLKLDWQE